MPTLSQLHAITNRILDAGKYDYKALYEACNDYYATLVQMSEINEQDEKNRRDVWLESGNAIGPVWAGMCIIDILRTKRFTEGIYRAAADKIQQANGKPVHILYTGTGPFATLILPLTARFSSSQIQFTFIEVNPHSFASLKRLFSQPGLCDYVKSMTQADATKWQLPAGDPVDIFICETMQLALKSEPQVAICMNILPQLPPGAIMIPEEIVLEAALMEVRGESPANGQITDAPYKPYPLGTIFTVNRETLLEQIRDIRKKNVEQEQFPEVVFSIPANIKRFYPELYVLTDITVYKQERLLLNESQLTMPFKLFRFGEEIPTVVKLQYQNGAKPGLRHVV